MGGGGVMDQVTQLRARLGEVQERQKTLALLHMKIAQGDMGMDISKIFVFFRSNVCGDSQHFKNTTNEK